MEYGLIGEKLSHSFSLEVHNLIGKYSYELKEIEKDKLRDFILQKNYKGLNVTIPYKKEVIKFLDEISLSAKEIGAVNTIVNKNGKLYGYNTDFLGARDLILYNDIEVKGKNVLILGSGATSLTLSKVVSHLKANKILRVSRTKKDGFITYEEAEKDYNDFQIIINTTPVGMHPNIDNSPIRLEKFKNLESVIDVVYNPINTTLIKKAKELNVKAVSGLYMLVAQAVYASSFFLGEDTSTNLIKDIYKKILLNKSNIVLIGPPSCGKTTVGKALSQKLSKEFIDTDQIIACKSGMEIAQIFSKYGEDYFRNLETEVIKNLVFEKGKIISIGGGAILRKENYENLAYNGILVFINRSLENLISSSDRPLTNSKEKLQKIYNERLPIYKERCDYIVNGDLHFLEVASEILKEITK